MTFGEHLEELRSTLIRSLLWLIVGTAFGLIVGDKVVGLIIYPLEGAMTEHYVKGSQKDYKKFLTSLADLRQQHIDQQKAAGIENPGDLTRFDPPYTIKEMEAITKNNEWVLDVQLVDQWRLELPQNVSSSMLLDAEPMEPPPKKDDGDEEKEAASEEDLPTSPNLVQMIRWTPAERDERISARTFNATEAFMLWLKASLLAGFIFVSPMIFREVWLFVAAGLYPHEKRYVHVFLPFSIALFLSGALFCFFIVFQYVLGFLIDFNASLDIGFDPRISEWLSFALVMPLAFGLSFQLPLVMLFLQRIGVFTVEAYLSKWRIAVLVIAIVSMILTPADPTSMVAMLVPLTTLYFFGILLCKYMPERKGILEE